MIRKLRGIGSRDDIETIKTNRRKQAMKKIMIVAVLVCATAIAQAATVSWSVSGLKGSDGNTLTTGAAYVFCTKGDSALSVEAVKTALAAYASASDIQNYLTDKSLTNLKGSVNSEGGVNVSSVNLATSGVPARTSTVRIFAVIVDDDSFSANMKYVVLDLSNSVKTPDATTSNEATFTISPTASQTASNWAAVPEPTSGLLMLLGMAGLALKRKRA